MLQIETVHPPRPPYIYFHPVEACKLNIFFSLLQNTSCSNSSLHQIQSVLCRPWNFVRDVLEVPFKKLHWLELMLKLCYKCRKLPSSCPVELERAAGGDPKERIDSSPRSLLLTKRGGHWENEAWREVKEESECRGWEWLSKNRYGSRSYSQRWQEPFPSCLCSGLIVNLLPMSWRKGERVRSAAPETALQTSILSYLQAQYRKDSKKFLWLPEEKQLSSSDLARWEFLFSLSWKRKKTLHLYHA